MKTSAAILERMKEYHPSLIDFSLGRILALLEKLDNPHTKLPPVIHIAGTNGKGSTLAFIRAICEAADLRMHCFVSPHLVTFHERIQLAPDHPDTVISQSLSPQNEILDRNQLTGTQQVKQHSGQHFRGPSGPKITPNCQPISEQRLIEVLEETEKANDGDDITFFEITAAAAFLAFSKYPADLLILETGLGGRLDATNIIDQPALTVITPIALDHMHYLGDTLAKIAGEKAGIIKPNRPCVSGHQDPEVIAVLAETCYKTNSALISAGQDWDCYQEHNRMVFQSDSHHLNSGSGVIDLPLPNLLGSHQIRNAGTAIAATLSLKQFNINADHISRGVTTAYWPGRLQRLKADDFDNVIHPESQIWLDGGHNPAAGIMLSQYMADLEERVPSPLYMIYGMMAKKDAGRFLTCFTGLVSYMITVPVPGSNPENPTSYNPEDLAELAQDLEIPAIAAPSVETALVHISTLSEGKPVRILICGSLYLAGHVLEGIENRA